MRLEVVGSPKGIRLVSLSFEIANNANIGIDDECEIILPPFGPLEGNDAKLLQINQNWFVESLADDRLAINQSDQYLAQGQRVMLRQGDTLFIRGFHLKASLGQEISSASSQLLHGIDDLSALCPDSEQQEHESQLKQAKLIKAMEFALEQALVEFEPWRVEKNIKDRHKHPLGLGPNYWKEYHKYFDRMVAEQKIKQKFFSNFWESVEKDGGSL